MSKKIKTPVVTETMYETSRPKVSVPEGLTRPEILEMIDKLFGVLAIREGVVHVTSPADIFAANLDMQDFDQEHLRVVYMNTRNEIMEIVNLYVGSVNHSSVRIAELFKVAVARNYPAMIVVHNHPSGDPSPSPDDVAMTRAVVQAGSLLDIDVLDHVVIGKGRYASLKGMGLGFSK